MKNLTETLITEAAAKNVHNPRKGSTVWVLKEGDTKALPIKIADNHKVKSAWYGKSGGYDINIELAQNEYNIEGWIEAHYGGNFDYSDEKYQVKLIVLTNTSTNKNETYYVGTSKEAIQEYIRTAGSKKLEGILKQIEKVQSELNELMQKKQRAEAEANLEINESLK